MLIASIGARGNGVSDNPTYGSDPIPCLFSKDVPFAGMAGPTKEC